MLEDLKTSNYAPTTVECYIRSVAEFAKHFHQSPDQLGPVQIRAWQLFLIKEKRVSQSTYIQAVCGLCFFYWEVPFVPACYTCRGTQMSPQAITRRSMSRALVIVGALFLLLVVGIGTWWSVRWALGRARAFKQALNSTVDESFQLRADQYHYEILAGPRYQDPKRLNRYEAKVFSQNGEDGVTLEIFRRIGSTNKVFAEFGAADGSENNTVLFLNAGWSGLWIDGDPDLIDRVRSNFTPEIQGGRLQAVRGFITAENIETLFSQAKLPPEFDLLSIDIDRNDYWVWKAIQQFRPRVVIMEYNAIFPPAVDWVVEYAADKWWDHTSHFGASLAALERLGKEKGYTLVGCETSGTNAFFVRADLVRDKFQAPFTADNHYEPPRYFNAHRRPGHLRRSYGGGTLRLLISPAAPIQQKQSVP